MNEQYKEYKELIAKKEELDSRIKELEEQFDEVSLFKVTLYLYDTNRDCESVEEFIGKGSLDRALECTDCTYKIAEIEKVDIPFHDDIDINFKDAPVSAYEKYFEEEE